jgi:hypothetical protein
LDQRVIQDPLGHKDLLEPPVLPDHWDPPVYRDLLERLGQPVLPDPWDLPAPRVIQAL